MIRVFSLVLALLAVRLAAEPEVAFTGVLVADGKTRFALTEKSTGILRWVNADSAFFGYTIVAYDAKAEALTLRKGAQEYRVALAPLHATGQAPESTPAAPDAGPSGGGTPPPPPSGNDSREASASEPDGAPTPLPTQPPTFPAEPSPAHPQPNIHPQEPVAPEATATAPAPENTTSPPGTPANEPTGAADTPPGATTAAPSGTYVVQPGDTPATIAQAAGLTLEQLQALNPDSNAGSLQAGQVIRIR